MAQPTIEVRANYLGQLPGADPHYHLLIVVRDGRGNNTYYRGGPSDNVTSSGASSGTTGSSGGSPGTGGKLITEFGPYVPGGTDFNRNAKVIYKAKLNTEDVSGVKNSLVNQMNAIHGAKINYFPTGPNSNSTVGTALRNIGINIQIPKGMWVPGFESQLVNRNGQRISSNNTSPSSAQAAALVKRLNTGNPVGGNNTTPNSGKAAELAARAATEPIEKQLNKSNPNGLQEQKSTPIATGAVADNKKVQRERGISRQ